MIATVQSVQMLQRKIAISRRSAADCGEYRQGAVASALPWEQNRMKTADALMVIYYVVLSGVLVFTLGYLAGWRHAKRGQ